MDKIDLTKNDNIQENENIELTFEEIINAGSGLSRDGQPASVGRIMINHALDKDTVKNDDEASFGSAIIDYFASGGCIVLQADFPMKNTRDFEHIANICSTYFENVNDEAWHENRDLMVVMIPMAFYGDIVIVLRDLVYFTSINLDNGGIRLIMCFNNTMTQLIENEDIDYNAIALEVRGEDAREEEDLQNELMMAEKELKELEEMDNEFAFGIQRNLSHETLMNKEYNTENADVANPGFRFTSDED